MNIRDKLQIDNTLKLLKEREGELSNSNTRKVIQNLEEKLKSNSKRHPEPAPNSLISGIIEQKNGYKSTKVDKSVIIQARDETQNPVENKNRLD